MKILCAALCAASAMLLLWGASARAATETVLYSFCIQQGCADGEYPYGDLLRVKDKLYATTTTGGGGNNGTVVSVDIATGAATVYAFDGNDRSSPYAGLINANGTLYGTTSEGGSGQNGTVFVLNRKNGKESVSYPFCSQDKCADGADPRGGLAILNGLFYGTTVNGGTGICNNYPACGVLYSLDPATGVETVLHSFCSQSSCADGGAPRASLIAVNGKLYGTTTEGGTGSGFCNDEVSGCGTVFDFDPATRKVTLVA